MNTITQSMIVFGLLFLASCGFIGSDKTQIEQAWLDKDQQFKSIIDEIRSQGIDVVASGAKAGSLSQCIATTLANDPLGQLVSVEGALAESTKITELMSDLQGAMEQEFSLSQIISLLQQGADLATYASVLVEQQGLEQALLSVEQLARSGGEFASQDLGGHFRQLLLDCREAR
ncbi:hypothetical protein [Shewanella psychrotolerans]|uniref:hypothetical protein n=1 Tax=Shewanella psychrotolerans TaxID=2864206 RepID=UPI001C659176|nr:hypothetical protein [Shewanella psychrotolerans]QYK02042.1 hypothetical protein K0I62_03435 [Shewanella psychrotolerans]